MAKKYKIKGLTENLSLLESSRVINRFRYNVVVKRIKKYLTESTQDNLHELRISIRRLRYSLENFRICYSKNEFLIIIEYMKFLQDIIGEIRDLDVLPEKIKSFEVGNKISISNDLYSAIYKEKERNRPKIFLELGKFLKNKTIRDFFISK